jgi:hypothetical protein
METKYCSEVKPYSTVQSVQDKTRQNKTKQDSVGGRVPHDPIGADDSTGPRLSQLLNWAADLMLNL